MEHEFYAVDAIDEYIAVLEPEFQVTSWADSINASLDDPIAMKDKGCLAALNLARECNTLDVLPLEFYHCCHYSHSPTGAGVTGILDGVAYGEEKAQLSPADLQTLLFGRVKLLKLNADLMKVILKASNGSIRGESCTTRKRCVASLAKIALKCSDDGGFYSTQCLDSIVTSFEQWATESAEYSVCSSCTQAIDKAEEVQRAKAFSQLNSIFGVEDWPRVVDDL